MRTSTSKGVHDRPHFLLCGSSKRCYTRRALPRLFGRRRFHHRLRTLLLPHRSALAPLSVFASLWGTNPRKWRIRKPSCFHESHDITSRATVSMLLYQYPPVVQPSSILNYLLYSYSPQTSSRRNDSLPKI